MRSSNLLENSVLWNSVSFCLRRLHLHFVNRFMTSQNRRFWSNQELAWAELPSNSGLSQGLFVHFAGSCSNCLSIRPTFLKLWSASRVLVECRWHPTYLSGSYQSKVSCRLNLKVAFLANFFEFNRSSTEDPRLKVQKLNIHRGPVRISRVKDFDDDDF